MKGTPSMPINKLVTKIVLIFCALLIASAAFADTTSVPDVLMLANGSAQTCETVSGAQLPACNSFLPGNEPFLLLIKATKTQTTKYIFTIMATMQDGTTRIVTGQVGRSDDEAGYTATSIDLGCEPVSVHTTIEEAATV
jgi:hypothetical protein